MISAPVVTTNGGTVPSIDNLSRRAKAAIIVRVLLNEGAELPLEELPEQCQEELTKAMGNMRIVDKETVTQVIEEFANQVDKIGLSFPEGIAGALNSLDGKINPLTAARMRKEAGVRELGDPWARIQDMSTEVLVPVLEQETPEVAAVLLSKLDTKKSAALLGALDGPKARSIAYAVSLTERVTPDAVDRIGLSIATQLSARPVLAFEEDPVQRVGAILNSSTSITREDVLEGLDEQDEGFANAVRKAIFTFANIPARIAPRDIPRILREVIRISC
jgi:flagellar motor switch protein FliG